MVLEILGGQYNIWLQIFFYKNETMGRLMKTKVNLNILNINKQFDWIQRLNLQIVNIHIPHGLEYLYYILSVAFPYLLPPRESLHCSPGIGGRKLESCSADVTTVCSVSTGVPAFGFGSFNTTTYHFWHHWRQATLRR